MEDVTAFKLAALFGLLIISVIASLAPLKFAAANPQRSETILAHFSFYTGGIFLGAGLLHMLPDAIKDQAEAHLFPSFPVALLTSAFGFISIWALEKIHFGDELTKAPIERERMVAVSAKAWLKSANICYITVAPTTTYGTMDRNTLKVSNVPPRSISSPALSAIKGKGGQVEHVHSVSTPKQQGLNSPLVVSVEQLPPEVQESLTGSPVQRSANSHSHSHSRSMSQSRRRSNSSVSTITENDSLSDNDNGVALSSYQKSQAGHDENNGGNHVIDMNNPKELTNKVSPQHKRLIINTINEQNNNTSPLDKGTASPRSGTLRHQAHANNHKQKPKVPTSVRSLKFSNQCDSPNRGVHEHVSYDVSGYNHNHSHGNGHKHNSSSENIVMLPSDDESKPLMVEKGGKHHHHDHDDDVAFESHQNSDDVHNHQHSDVHHHTIVIPGNLFLPLALTAVFSLHSVIEGAALGIQNKLSSGAISILIAITSHKAIEAITVSSNFVKEKVEFKTAIPIILIYCLMTPLGILIGLISDEFVGADNTVLVTTEISAYAAGSFVYLAIHEISDENCCNKVSGRYQVSLMVLGLVTMALLAVWT